MLLLKLFFKYCFFELILFFMLFNDCDNFLFLYVFVIMIWKNKYSLFILFKFGFLIVMLVMNLIFNFYYVIVNIIFYIIYLLLFCKNLYKFNSIESLL